MLKKVVAEIHDFSRDNLSPTVALLLDALSLDHFDLFVDGFLATTFPFLLHMLLDFLHLDVLNLRPQADLPIITQVRQIYGLLGGNGRHDLRFLPLDFEVDRVVTFQAFLVHAFLALRCEVVG